MSRLLLSVLALATVGSSLPVTGAEPAEAQKRVSPEQIAFFENKVRPVLAEHCYGCHGPEGDGKGELRVNSRAAC